MPSRGLCSNIGSYLSGMMGWQLVTQDTRPVGSERFIPLQMSTWRQCIRSIQHHFLQRLIYPLITLDNYGDDRDFVTLPTLPDFQIFSFHGNDRIRSSCFWILLRIMPNLKRLSLHLHFDNLGSNSSDLVVPQPIHPSLHQYRSNRRMVEQNILDIQMVATAPLDNFTAFIQMPPVVSAGRIFAANIVPLPPMISLLLSLVPPINP